MSAVRYWGVVPAAGLGRRMGGETPKQYLELAGAAVLQRTLDKLLALDTLQAVVVALAADDPHWAQLPAAKNERVLVAPGGGERCDSVLSGLQRLCNFGRDIEIRFQGFS